MSEYDTVSFSLEINVEQAYTETRRLLTVLFRALDLVERLSGHENLNDAINEFQRAIVIANSLRLTLIALHAASGPVGWALALIGAAGTALTTGEYLYDAMRGASRW